MARPASGTSSVAKSRRVGMVLVGVVVVVLVAVAAFITWRDDRPATGRAGDACSAKGPAGLVGIDLRTGKVRWHNVVGASLSSLSDAGNGQMIVRESYTKRSRTVRIDTGAVTSCRGSTKSHGGIDINPPRGPHFTLDDGRTYRSERAGYGTVTATRPDGSEAWTAGGRRLWGASDGGIAVQAPRADRSTKPVMSMEVLDPADGSVRWKKEIWGSEAMVTATNLVVVDQTNGTKTFPDPGSRSPSQIAACRLTDGSPSWQTEVARLPYQLFGDDQTVLVPDGFNEHLTALDAADGHRRWTIDLPSPGQAAKWTEAGEIRDIFIDRDEGVAVVAIVAEEPYRD